MLKTFWIALFFAAAFGSAPARAQTGGFDGAGLPPKRTDSGLLIEKNLTPTGETVPHPGESQSGGTTPLDRAIEREDNKVDQGICSNCR
jgi:hypothetical protein